MDPGSMMLDPGSRILGQGLDEVCMKFARFWAKIVQSLYGVCQNLEEMCTKFVQSVQEFGRKLYDVWQIFVTYSKLQS